MRSANAWQAERLPVWGVLGGSPKQDRVVRTKISWKRFEVIQKFRGILASMSVIEEIPFSQLVQHPKATMAKLEESPRRRIRLDRRDGEDLILESAARAEAEDSALIMASRLFFSLSKNDNGVRALLLALPTAFPWVHFLPERGTRAFLAELVDTLHACADLGNVAALVPVINAWKNTAEIYSDPELLKAATTPLDGADYGEVPGGLER